MIKKPSSGKTDSSQNVFRSDWLTGGGEMDARIRMFDWSKTPLGPIEQWSSTLRMMVSFLLANRFPLLLWWGPQYVSIYNDAYRPVLGMKHPKALGQPVSECWSEIWHILQPLIDTPFQGGPATWMDDISLEINRHGFVEETHFTIAYSPVPDETTQDGIGGVLATVHEISEKVVGERRVGVLRDLGARSVEAKSGEEACAIAAEILSSHAKDVPFALLYVIDVDRTCARLAGASGVEIGGPASPTVIDLVHDTQSNTWPLARALKAESLQLVQNLANMFPAVPRGPWAEPPHEAVVVPIRSNIAHQLAGFFVAGISPRLRFDHLYRSFMELVSAQIATAIANARAYAEERRRAEALAEIDRVKTAFFSNVSHEFRTPLTLMLGPIEDELRERPHTPRLEVAHRNSLRLLKLVNTLLDFSRIEAGRLQAFFEPTDLAAFTVELASVFRSATERAGLRLVMDCPTVPEPVYVDRSMWEKIVLNLMSNAFKFTFEGEIVVSVRQAEEAMELRVRDTGVGIPAEGISRLFERFYRVENMRSRTHEGSGIGLALVHELVKLHAGSVRAESRIGEGSTFIVTVPLGTKHLPPDRIGGGRGLVSAATTAVPYVEEALRWLPSEESSELGVLSSELAERPIPDNSTLTTHNSELAPPQPRVLIADDNADMRDYVSRLLAHHYNVEAVADGQIALERIRTDPPDLVLTDVMMPRLDGFGLLRNLRADPATQTIPVIVLSARAGEEASVEGLGAGADDYLIKPFSARELLARVEAHVKMARLRREAGKALRDSEQRFRNMADHAPVMIRVTEPGGTCTFLSRSWYEFTGQTAETGLGFGWLEAVRPEDRARVDTIFQAANEKHEQFRIEYRLKRHDGEYRWVIDAAAPFIGEGGEFLGYIGSVIDITERKRQETEVIGQSRQQRLLHEFADAVNRAEELADLYDKAVDAIISSLNADRASILLFDEDGVMRFKAWRGLSDHYRRTVEGHSPWQKDTPNPCSIVVDDIAQAGIDEELQAVIQQEGIQALGFIPLMYGGRLLGKFMVYFNRPHAMNDEEIRQAQAIAGTLALGIERKMTQETLRTSEERLRYTNTELTQRIAELQKANAEVEGSRRAALNLMEDAVQSRQAVETLNLALRESEERYRSLVSVITDVSWVTDAAGAFIAPQPEWQAYTGQTWEEHGGFGWANALHPEDRDRVKAVWLRACETRTLYESRGRVWHAPMQQWRHYVARATPIFHPDGSVREWVGTCTDIHELKQTEEELRRLNDELEARVEDRTRELVASQERLRSLAAELNLTEQRERQRVASDLHDYLAQLLALSMIKLGQVKKQAVAPLVTQALTDVQQVMEQALAYTRTMVAQLSPPIQDEFGLPMALRWLAEQMQPRDFIVSLELESESLPLPEDQARLLYQSVRELLINVVKHGQTDHARVTVTLAEGVLRIAVTDQGAGFDLAAAGKTSRVPSFGLFSIRERMISLGGSFELVSRPGEGTTATLVLPLDNTRESSAELEVLSSEAKDRGSEFAASDSPDNSKLITQNSELPQRASCRTPATSRIRVLLADDHAMVRQGLISILVAYQDISVVGEASDGEEAVELARVLSPDVVVMDVNMPKMDGVEAIRRVKAQQPATCIVGLSLSRSSQVELLVLQAGASCFVSKDAAADRLYEAILGTMRPEQSVE